MNKTSVVVVVAAIILIIMLYMFMQTITDILSGFGVV